MLGGFAHGVGAVLFERVAYDEAGTLLTGSFMDYLVWNEIPTVLGNLVGGLAFVGLTLYTTHHRTGSDRLRKNLAAIDVVEAKVPAGTR